MKPELEQLLHDWGKALCRFDELSKLYSEARAEVNRLDAALRAQARGFGQTEPTK